MTYTYRCKKCNELKNLDHSMKEDPKVLCNKCGEEMKIIIFGGSTVLFNASGFTKRST